MIKKYRRVFGIKTVSLSDNSTITCKTGEKIEMNKMMVLLTGDSWYISRKKSLIFFQNLALKIKNL